MTKKQKRFVDEYLIDLNATQAAIRAGYKAKNGQRASEIGHELLQKTQVSEAISEAIAERSKRTGINADRVLLELARIAFVNADDVINAKDATLPMGVYALEKNDYAELRNDACVSKTKLKDMIRIFKSQGFKVYANGR